ncbi:MAG TPA: response regulator transcription factor [Candidatus Paceibacterota bacterium]|nr:response regulator transcription factor [Candidatus Paceibacterota bacterium]
MSEKGSPSGSMNVSMDLIPRIRVLVADDHPIYRAGLVERLEDEEGELTVVGEASNGHEAVEMTQSLRPDVVLMDLHMPLMTGIEATAKIKADFPGIQVLILSATTAETDLRDAIIAGASGYLVKTSSPAELRQAIITCLDEESEGIPLPLTLDDSAMFGNSKGLSKRELQILELVAKGETNKAIGVQFNLSSRTIEVHMRNIFTKLGVSSRTEAVTTAIRDQAIQLP